MVGIELVKEKQTKEPFDWSLKKGVAVCQKARERGVMIRPLGNVIVLMPPPAIGEETLKEFEVRSYKKRTKKSRPVKYWGIIAIVDGRKIKAIVRKIGDNGTMHFWSVVPAWVTNKYRDTRFFTTMKGNPEED